ncbi:MAG: ferredoxin [Actinomycetes bacterium]
MALRLRVDPVACDGYGHCAELAGEGISLDEWGYPIIAEGPIKDRHLALVDLAIRQCPRKALFSEEVTRVNAPGVARR